jgi:antitoxin HigA-1
MINGVSYLNGTPVTHPMLKLLTIIKTEIMARLSNIHPGEVLLEEFLLPLNISAYKLAKDIEIPQTRISEILKGNRRITADTALRLSKYFGNSAKFWLGLQDDFDIEEELLLKGNSLKSIKSYDTKAA